ncbi:fibroblast growth factor 18-like isoform X2 [Lytechinus variegatus]|uniref:fibroblast growth factor 18-like isoform X2 n=1 Tax=Lytechinus variegatus TaxID=7654 RepID=UPI001BB15187|nr:fibroblast growth factor 18-like isoform X2 [Lytechinus variegatus]
MRMTTLSILLQFLLWCLSIHVTKARSGVMPLNNFDPTTDTSNFNSGSTTRLQTLYNRASSRYVRVQGRRVDAKGSQDDPHAQLLITTTDLNSRVLIQGNKSKNYLCVNGKGELISKNLLRRLKDGGTSCLFQHSVSMFSRYDGFASVQNPSWVLAFKGNGDSKKASKARLDTRSSQFLFMPADDDINRNEEAFKLLLDDVLNEIQKAIRDSTNEGGRRRSLDQGRR